MEPRDAATVLLIRDAPDLHVFMLQRNLRSVFAAGFHVYPGGAVDPDDDVVAEHAAGAAQLPPGLVRFAAAAVREAFEEAGVLLARDATTGAPVHGETLARAAARRHERERFPALLDDLGLVADLDALVPLARFVTPAGAPRRFDTWFFLAPAPTGHVYRHDDGETVASEWVTPAAALDRRRAGVFPLVEPTAWTLETIAGFRTCDEVLAAATDAWAARPAAEVDPIRGWVLDLGAGASTTTTSRRRKHSA